MQLANVITLEQSDFDPYVVAVQRPRGHHAIEKPDPNRMRPVYHDRHGYPPVWYKRHWNISEVSE